MFKKYIKKPLIVEAIKWDGSEKTLELIRQRIKDVYMDTGRLVIGGASVFIGDYIVIGEPHSYEPDIFKKMHTKVENIDHECADCLYFSTQYISTYIPYLDKVEESKKPACSFGGKIRTIPTRYRTPLWCPIKP